MKIILHDLNQHEFAELNTDIDTDNVIISDNGAIHNCIGCFGCWIKTPGICVLNDGYSNMGELLSKCDQLIIISRCVYGSYSAFIRNVLDRCIPYLSPYFVKLNGETHHKNRYENTFVLSAHFYGDDITEKEQKTAKALVKANGINFYASENKVYFHESLKTIKGGSE